MQGGTGGGFFAQIAEEPALVQLAAVLLVLGLAAFWLGRLSHRVREAREREGTREYLLGVEQALHGDFAGAARRLERSVRDDPANATARLLHAELLTLLGRPAEAHREHVMLLRAFGSRAARNDVGLARALLGTGRAREAAEAAARAARQRPEDVTVLRVWFAAESAADHDESAAECGARLAARLPVGQDRDAVRGAAAARAERAAGRALREGRRDDARRMLGIARRAVGDADPVIARIEARIRIADGALRALPDGTTDAAVPTPADHAALAHAGVPLRFSPLDSPGRALDAILANRQHVERLCRAAIADGGGEAIAELVELGPAAAAEMLDQAIERGPDDATFPAVFAAIGVRIVPALIDAWGVRRARARENAVAREQAITVFARILAALGPDAQAELEPHLTAEDRSLRKALIDYHLALADPAAFARVLEVLPPVEVVQRMNDAPDRLLVPFLRCLPAGHFAVEVLLPDGGFVRDVAVLEAIHGAAAPEALEQLVVRRGYARSLVTALVERLADPRLAPVARRLLDGFGAKVLPTLVMAFADLDRPDPLRRAIGDRLVQAGSRAVQPLCRCFGSAADPLDSDVMDVLVRIGDAAIPELREAYRQGGLLERVAGPFARRRTHRREMLIWTLCGIGTLAARTTLASLREREADADLALRLAQALHRVDERGPRLEARRLDDGGRAGHGG